MSQTVQSEAESPRCGCVYLKGDPRTLESFRFVCDLPLGHMRGHEGNVEGGTARLGWPSDKGQAA